MVSSEGGATERLINHSCIVIDFLLKGVSQTLNYLPVCVSACVCLCAVLYFIERTKSSITSLDFAKVWQFQLLRFCFKGSLHSWRVVTTFKPLVPIVSTVTVKDLIIHAL